MRHKEIKTILYKNSPSFSATAVKIKENEGSRKKPVIWEVISNITGEVVEQGSSCCRYHAAAMANEARWRHAAKLYAIKVSRRFLDTKPVSWDPDGREAIMVITENL